MKNSSSRREFFEVAFGSAMSAALAHEVVAQTSSGTNGLPTRVLGRTGERVPILCLGGWHIGHVPDESLAIRIMHSAIDEGLTFFDTCWDYQDGGSEKRVGKALSSSSRRSKVFLMTKNCERDYEGTIRNLEDSLRRLQTDRIDLWQFHEINYDNDPDWVIEKGGLKAALEAQKAGKVRYIGFTGHKDPRIHLRMLAKDHLWDTSQMPINVMDAHYRSFQKEVVPVCLRQNVGVLGMKSLGGGSPRGKIPTGAKIDGRACIRYALSLPVSSLVVGMVSMEDLQQNLKIARGFQPMSQSEMSKLLSKVRHEATDGRHEPSKSTQVYDGPHHQRQHGFAV